jgi:hypothetical protein
MEAAHERGAPAAWTIQAIAPPQSSTAQKMIAAFLKKGPRDLPFPLVTLDDKGSRWTSLIGTNNWNNNIDFLVNEEVMKVLNSNGITKCESRKVEFQTIPKKKLRETPRPEYYTLEQVSGFIPKAERLTSGEIERSAPVVWRTVVDPKSLKGADLAVGKHVAYCTLRLIELARANSWSNFRFYPADSVRVRRIRKEMVDPLPVDYLGKQWPPVTWYPDRHFELAALCNQKC